jgi:flagellar hook assembly protein FlgD
MPPAHLKPPRREGGVPQIAARIEPGRMQATFEWHAPLIAGTRTIELYDLSGRRLRRIPLGEGEDGELVWDGKDDGGHRMPAGLYFARLTSGSLRAQARVVLIP